MIANIGKILRQVFLFYYDGFRNMTVGKRLWLIIIIKLFIIFFVLRLFFFPNILDKKFKTQAEKSDYIIQELTKNAN